MKDFPVQLLQCYFFLLKNRKVFYQQAFQLCWTTYNNLSAYQLLYQFSLHPFQQVRLVHQLKIPGFPFSELSFL